MATPTRSSAPQAVESQLNLDEPAASVVISHAEAPERPRGDYPISIGALDFGPT